MRSAIRLFTKVVQRMQGPWQWLRRTSLRRAGGRGGSAPLCGRLRASEGRPSQLVALRRGPSAGDDCSLRLRLTAELVAVAAAEEGSGHEPSVPCSLLFKSRRA